MKYYIQVVGPYDSTFVGPFTSIDIAHAYIRGLDRSIFDAYIMNEAAFQANLNTYGIAHITPPEVTQ
jgi:hypothetical protein